LREEGTPPGLCAVAAAAEGNEVEERRRVAAVTKTTGMMNGQVVAAAAFATGVAVTGQRRPAGASEGGARPNALLGTSIPNALLSPAATRAGRASCERAARAIAG
jgi:hypothetical protein